MPAWLRRPVMNQILREAPAVEEIFHAEKNWAVSLIIVKQGSKNIGSSVAQVGAEGDIEILGIDRADTYLTRPNWDERIAEGDRLLVYADRKAVKRIVD
jgi:Trk K+ transport system NAD-binding subunit